MKRFKNNPIITRNSIPDVPGILKDVTSVFNPGAAKFNNQTILILRVQARSRETFLMKAVSKNGIDFDVIPEIIEFEGIERIKEKIFHIYDARITKLGEKYLIMFAMDLPGRCELGLGETTDFINYKFLGKVSDNDNRNGVLFPEKINGQYARLERPNKHKLNSGVTTGGAIVYSVSNDLLNWEERSEVFAGRLHYWDELIGAGVPPIKTRDGWLLIYHGIAMHLSSSLIYQAGVALLDLSDPSKLIARGKSNILEPREIFELTGQVPNVIFPSGAVVSEYDAEGFAPETAVVNIYYGAADTSVCLAQTTIGDLLNNLNE